MHSIYFHIFEKLTQNVIFIVTFFTDMPSFLSQLKEHASPPVRYRIENSNDTTNSLLFSPKPSTDINSPITAEIMCPEESNLSFAENTSVSSDIDYRSIISIPETEASSSSKSKLQSVSTESPMTYLDTFNDSPFLVAAEVQISSFDNESQSSFSDHDYTRMMTSPMNLITKESEQPNELN